MCIELLRAEGCSKFLSGGTGPDQGKDILADISYVSILGEETRRFIVECKHKKSVGKNDFASTRNALALHQVDGLLYITSGDFSGTVVSQVNALRGSKRESYAVELWNGLELSMRLRKHPHLIRKYFYPDNSKSSLPLAEGIQQELTKKYGLRGRHYSAETYPIVPENEHIAAELVQYAKNFFETSPTITLLEGGIGSGKTWFGRSLLILCKEKGKSVSVFQSNEFTIRFFRYHLADENDFLPFCQLCEDIDILFIDDLGWDDYLRDASYTQQLAAQEFCRIIQLRRIKMKPTIIAINPQAELGTTCRLYLEKLKREEHVLDLGKVNLFYYSVEQGRVLSRDERLGEVIDGQIKSVGESAENTGQFSSPRHQTIYIMSDLANDHLHERLEIVEAQVDDLIRFVTTPIAEDEETRRILRERRGYDYVSTRDEDIFNSLEGIASSLREFQELFSSYSYQTENPHK